MYVLFVLCLLMLLLIDWVDEQIKVQQTTIDTVCNTFAPPSNPVFELIPLDFAKYAKALYETMGSPIVFAENIWDIYRELVNHFKHLEDAIEFGEACQAYLQRIEEETQAQEALPPARIELLGGPKNINKDGYIFLGGVNHGRGMGELFSVFLYLDFINLIKTLPDTHCK